MTIPAGGIPSAPLSATLFLAAVCSSTPARSEVLTWTCTFDQYTSLEGIADADMTMVFKVDTQTGRALMEGNNGISDVGIFIGDTAFSFTEEVASGTVQTTTITRDGLAVHSRNTVLAGRFVASQYFGACLFD